jgi:hypothetical protein
MAFSEAAVAGWTGKPLMREASRASTWVRIFPPSLCPPGSSRLVFACHSGPPRGFFRLCRRLRHLPQNAPFLRHSACDNRHLTCQGTSKQLAIRLAYP